MKLDILFHYEVNESTGEIKYIGKEEINVDTQKSTVKISTKLEGDEPLLQLNGNNYAINEAACKILNVAPGNKLHINYQKKDGNYIPAIGNSDVFGVKSGNLLTKSCTVSYRGKANEKLAEFGNIFKFEPAEKEGIFYLMGDKMDVQKEEVIKIDETFELDDLEDIDLDDNDLDISNINLTL